MASDISIDPSTKKWIINGVIQDFSAVGQDGATPQFNQTTKTWFINGQDTGVKAEGEDGKDGKSAYQLAVDNGYPSSLDNWLASLKGDKGDKGDSAITVKVGTTSTGDETKVTNSGTDTDLVLDFTFAPKDLEGLASYAKTSDLANYATKTDLTNYYTSAQMDNKLSAKADLTMIANIADKDTVQTLSNKVDQLNTQVNTQAQTIIKLQDQLNTVLAKLSTSTTPSSTTASPTQ